MSANERRRPAAAPTRTQQLHPLSKTTRSHDWGNTPAWRRVVDRDLGAGIRAWQHLYARGLTSPLVCAALFSRWGLCACGRCLTDIHGGDR